MTTFHNTYARTHEYIRTLASRGDLQELACYVDHPDMFVRAEVAEALARIGGPEALKVLEALAQTQDHDEVRGCWYVRGEAAIALAKVGGPKAVRLLEALAQDTDEYVRMTAAEALGQLAQ